MKRFSVYFLPVAFTLLLSPFLTSAQEIVKITDTTLLRNIEKTYQAGLRKRGVTPSDLLYKFSIKAKLVAEPADFFRIPDLCVLTTDEQQHLYHQSRTDKSGLGFLTVGMNVLVYDHQAGFLHVHQKKIPLP